MTLNDIGLLQELAAEAATREALADQVEQLRDLAEADGSIFAPAVRLIARSHRLHAIDLRGRSAALADDLSRQIYEAS